MEGPRARGTFQAVMDRRGVLREHEEGMVNQENFVGSGILCPADFSSRSNAQEVEGKSDGDAREPKQRAVARLISRTVWFVVVHCGMKQWVMVGCNRRQGGTTAHLRSRGISKSGGVGSGLEVRGGNPSGIQRLMYQSSA